MLSYSHPTGCRFRRHGVSWNCSRQKKKKKKKLLHPAVVGRLRNKLEFDAVVGRPFKLQLQRPICSRDVAQEIVIYSVTVRPYKFRSNNRLATVAKNKFDITTVFESRSSRNREYTERRRGWWWRGGWRGDCKGCRNDLWYRWQRFLMGR